MAAFTLSAVGLAFQFIGGLLMALFIVYRPSFGYYGPWTMGPWMMFGGPWFSGYYSYWLPVLVVLAVAVVAVGVLGVLWMNGADLNKVRTGSTLVLMASVIAFPTMFGFMIGSLLMIIGSILGLTWRPETK